VIVNQVPTWAKPFIVGEGTVEVEGQTYQYHIMDPDLQPDLKYFLGFPGQNFLLVSSDVPEEYREHVLRHEVVEFIYHAEEVGRCVASLRQELEGVPESIRAAYTTFRREQFRGLVAFYANQEGVDELKRELAGSLAFLETL
jgi:hypothetical protein